MTNDKVLLISESMKDMYIKFTTNNITEHVQNNNDSD